jgi:hypothetical protein
MIRIACVAMALVIIAVSLAGAEIYKCTRADGTVLFSDNPAQSSGDCTMERVEDLPPLGILPDTPPRPVSPPAAGRTAAPPTGADQIKSFDAFKSEAEQLIDQYNDAKRRSIRYSLVIHKQKALHELTDIRAKKTTLLGDIDQSAMSDDDKQQLRAILSRIAD